MVDPRPFVVNARAEAFKIQRLARQTLKYVEQARTQQGPKLKATIDKIRRTSDRVQECQPAFDLMQYLGQSAALRRLRSDRQIHLTDYTNGLARTQAQLERDKTNVEWLLRTAEDLTLILNDTLSMIDGKRAMSTADHAIRLSRKQHKKLVDITRKPFDIGERGIAVWAARAHCLDCWRGGLGNMTVWDEVLDLAHIPHDLGDADAAVIYGQGWRVVPAIRQAVIDRYLSDPDANRITFAPTRPGTSPIVMSRGVLLRMHAEYERAGPLCSVGMLLGYTPFSAQSDQINRENCVRSFPEHTGRGREMDDWPTNPLHELALHSEAELLTRHRIVIAHTDAEVTEALKGRKNYGGIPLPWVVPIFRKTKDNQHLLPAWYDRHVMLCGCAVVRDGSNDD